MKKSMENSENHNENREFINILREAGSKKDINAILNKLSHLDNKEKSLQKGKGKDKDKETKTKNSHEYEIEENIKKIKSLLEGKNVAHNKNHDSIENNEDKVKEEEKEKRNKFKNIIKPVILSILIVIAFARITEDVYLPDLEEYKIILKKTNLSMKDKADHLKDFLTDPQTLLYIMNSFKRMLPLELFKNIKDNLKDLFLELYPPFLKIFSGLALLDVSFRITIFWANFFIKIILNFISNSTYIILNKSVGFIFETMRKTLYETIIKRNFSMFRLEHTYNKVFEMLSKFIIYYVIPFVFSNIETRMTFRQFGDKIVPPL